MKALDACFNYRDSDVLSDRLVALLKRRIEIEESGGHFDYEGRLRLSLHFREARDFQGVYDTVKPMIDNPDGLHHTADSHFELYEEAVKTRIVKKRIVGSTFVAHFVRGADGRLRSAEKVNGAYCYLRSESGVRVESGDFWLVRFNGRDSSRFYVEPLKIIYSRDGFYFVLSQYEAKYSGAIRRAENLLKEMSRRCSENPLQLIERLTMVNSSPSKFYRFELPLEYVRQHLDSGLRILKDACGEWNPVLLPLQLKLADVELELSYTGANMN